MRITPRRAVGNFIIQGNPSDVSRAWFVSGHFSQRHRPKVFRHVALLECDIVPSEKTDKTTCNEQRTLMRHLAVRKNTTSQIICHLSIYYIYQSIYLSIYRSINQSIYLPIQISIYLSHLSIYLTAYLAIYPSTYLSTYRSIDLSISLSLSLSLSPSLSLSICQLENQAIVRDFLIFGS